LFVRGISPKWEDPQNKGGKYFTLEYIIKDDIDRFLPVFRDSWLKLMLSVIGESIEAAQYVYLFLLKNLLLKLLNYFISYPPHFRSMALDLSTRPNLTRRPSSEWKFGAIRMPLLTPSRGSKRMSKIPSVLKLLKELWLSITK
jgi:hypothetical protein